MDPVCPVCAMPLPPIMNPDAPGGVGVNFCPRCGKKIHEPPPSLSLGAQIIVYSISFFLPPLGLWSAWKYWRYGGEKGEKIAIAAVALTIIAIIITIWTAQIMINALNQSINNLSF